MIYIGRGRAGVDKLAPDRAARALGPFIAYDAGVAVEHPGIGGDSGLDPPNKFIRVGLGETASTLNFPAQVAAARGIPRARVALAWLLAKPVITAPIVGATKLQHLDDALASVSVKLSEEEIASLEEPYAPHAVVGFD